MQAAPLVLIHSNRSQTALERYRSTLCAVESQSISHLRLRMMCQLAEMLLRGLPNDVYKQPIEAPYKESAWKPKIYTAINQVKHYFKIFSRLMLRDKSLCRGTNAKKRY